LKKHLISVLATLVFVGTASAADISYQPVKKVFTWNGATPATADTIVPVPQFESRVVVTQEYAQCRPMSCVSQLPGRFDAWQGLFNASDRERPAILTRVLIGMSPEVSHLILEAGFLRRMPPNWQALETELMNAQNQLYSQGYYFNFMSAIFEQNGLMNAINLGYADANACASAPTYPCSVPSMKRETRQIGAVQRHVHFDVSGSLLLPYEIESLALQVGGPGQAPVVLSGDFDTRLTNQYQMTYDEGANGDLNVALRFVNRPMHAIPSNVLVTNHLSKVASGLQIDLGIDPNKLGALLARGGQLEVTMDLCRRDLLGGCAEKVATATGSISSGTFSTNFASTLLRSGKKYHVAVQLRAVGTPYFSGEFGDKEKSNKVDND
jgi:hypothetical protein